MAVHDMLMAAAGGTAGAVNYIDDVFSTYLYTGTGSSQTITNGIDLSTKGGMVWFKSRTTGGSSYNNHSIVDSARGASSTGYYSIYPNLTDGNFTPSTLSNAIASAFNSNGFTIQSNPNNSYNTQTEVSWTFRKQAKFFDVVTFTQTSGTGYITVNHNLGSAPGCIMVKRTDAAGDWYVYHRSLGTSQVIFLNYTDAAQAGSDFQSVTSTSFQFTNFDVGATYVAYLFAHDAGGFGTAGTDNVISCGSFTDVGSGGTNTINLGYEPQWVLVKRATGSTSYYQEWRLIDCMREMTVNGTGKVLIPNDSSSEGNSDINLRPNATGFTCSMSVNTGGSTYIYIAIRRPMKPPTTGTEVFKPLLRAPTNTATNVQYGFVTDAVIIDQPAGSPGFFLDRLRGNNKYLQSTGTDAEATTTGQKWDVQNGIVVTSSFNNGSTNYIDWAFRRAPGFFDVVCYTGDGTARSINHNLEAIPELVIIKERPAVEGAGWRIYQKFRTGTNKVLGFDNNLGEFNDTNAFPNSSNFSTTTFSVGTGASVNSSASYYVAYLFATLAGISKVGSYTGTGTTQQINCGFSSGARFVLIKRTNSTGDWYVWDSARGIVSGNDPYLLLNSTAAEVTSTDYIDPYSAGFEISSTAPAAINASGGSFIFLAIA